MESIQPYLVITNSWPILILLSAMLFKAFNSSTVKPKRLEILYSVSPCLTV